MEKKIKLTESELKTIIMETAKRMINEESLYGTHSEVCYQLAEDLLQVMEPVSLIAKIGERMGFFGMRRYLEGIARIELPDKYGQDEENL